MGALGNKLALHRDGKAVIQRTTEAFVQAGLPDIYLVVPAGSETLFRGLVCPVPVTLVTGGSTRQASVYAGLAAVPQTTEFVLIHDGARPFVTPALIARVLAATRECGACFPGVPLTDTVYEAGAGHLTKVLARDELVAVQTPQGFRRELILRAHREAQATGITATDDAALVFSGGHHVVVVEGEPANVKLTTPSDLARFSTSSVTRMGMGMDVHRLVPGRRLVLGGVEIPSSLGLLGHSDADVVTHAVMDALLGAAGLGDIGQHFPDSDERYLDADSLELLRGVAVLLKARQVQPIYVDVTLLLEAPKIGPYREEMRSNIAGALGLEANQINIKATTNEGLGYVGSGEGAVCYAAATVRLKEA
ncbi:MAG: Bifunctional enzyme IspD/IspF [Firmicutes bacterium]|nr:Bifunctional enzyme IspD/IspF [candidate division NPL-UPA2 bacterium]